MKHKAVFKLELQQRVLILTANGVWTLADAKDYVRQLRAMVQPIISQPWAIIMDAAAWQMSPADVFALLQDNTRWCFNNNLMQAVTILPDDQLLKWQFSKVTATEKPKGFISQTAGDIAAARKLVQAAGFSLTD